VNDLSVLRHDLPPPPARLLEVGCGNGQLARALDRSGYNVVAIDPEAPKGRIFRRTTIEAFEDGDGFDAVVAVTSLHHVENLDLALDKIQRLLRSGGSFVLEEFAYDRLLDDRTARWYFHQRQAAAATGQRSHRPLPRSFAAWRKQARNLFRHLHPYDVMQRALRRRFRRQLFIWTPYLYTFDLDPAVRPLEEELIRRRRILATGFRWVGRPRRGS
jgi:SAM-dependent methyltransferase